ncbi:MAG: hypothetical protein AB2A00_14130 [Myxococcota bacterium]
MAGNIGTDVDTLAAREADDNPGGRDRTAVRGVRAGVTAEWDVRLASSACELPHAWDALVPPERIFLTRSYLRALERTLPSGMRTHYALVRHQGDVVAVAAFQLVDFSLASCLPPEGIGARRIRLPCWAALRALAAAFRIRILVCGNLLTSDDAGFHVARGTTPAAAHHALQLTVQASLRHVPAAGFAPVVMIKDLPAELVGEGTVLGAAGYRADTYQPSMVLRIPPSWRTFDDYVAALRSKYRTRLKSVRNRGRALERRLLTPDLLERYADQVDGLFKEVASRASLNVISPGAGYFLELQQSLGTSCETVGYFLDDQLVGFNTRLRMGTSLESYMLGMSYAHAGVHALNAPPPVRAAFDEVDRLLEEREAALPPPRIPAGAQVKTATHPARDVRVVATVPPAGNAIRTAYVEAMRRSTDFYVENQYVTDAALARDMVEDPDRRRRGIVVIPYVPDVLRFTPLDRGVPLLGIRGAQAGTAYREMQVLKWLELKTAEEVLVRGEGAPWRSAGLIATPTLPGCAPPGTQLRIGGKAEEAPEALEPDTPLELVVWQGALHRGCPVTVTRNDLRVRDVMTRSRISAYTLLADDASTLAAGLHSIGSSFLAENAGIYVHGKAAVFYERGGGLSATVGSANLNERSLGLDTPGSLLAAVDTELNVFWDGASVAPWLEQLVREHTNGKLGADAAGGWMTTWDAWAWENLSSAEAGRWPGPSGTRMVRLDVVDRCVVLGGCP